MTDATVTEAQRAVLQYLEDHQITQKLNGLVNEVGSLCPTDPYAYLATAFAKLAKPSAITRLAAREILDSRGNPTVQVDVYATVNGVETLVGRAGAPSGASTGSNEAMELRDGDKARYLGKGVTKAVGNVSSMLSGAVAGQATADLTALDKAICDADGTELKKKVGGNAITAASFAMAIAGARVSDTELFLHLSKHFNGGDASAAFSLPRPMVNILNGGKHAGGNLKIQEFMIVPSGGKPFRESIRHCAEVYHHLGKILVAKFGPSAKNLGDEGGFAPQLEDPDEALSLLEEAVEAAGLVVGTDMFFALDAAASEFYDKEGHADTPYEIKPNTWLSSADMVQFYLDLKKAHPGLISIEDGMDEKDYEGWTLQTAKFAAEYPDVILVGDDLFTTNPNLITPGLEAKWANALLLKVNQIGSISEAMAAAKLLFAQGGNVAVSHRSGEVTGTLIADLAVAIGAQFIKTGATARGERVCKYNRLLAIEEYLIENKLHK
jgi:enolase